MVNITVSISEALRSQAESAASAHRLSLDEFVRQSLILKLNQGERASDPFFADTAVFSGEVPHDLSERHDDYLYGETE
jgi:hypothetical protein